MNTQHRQLLRVACLLHDQYLQRRRLAAASSVAPVESQVRPYLDQAFHLEQLLRRARSEHLLLATRRLQRQCRDALERAILVLDSARDRLRKSIPSGPNTRDLLQELIATEHDLAPIELDRVDQRISVTTESILLEGVSLGPFRIDLLLHRIPGREPSDWFCIEALEPNPAASNEDVTHPHVDSGRLCAGEAWQPINNALIDGRISEFFAVIHSVLQTYNPYSPYVKLEDWDGTLCSDCGYVMSEGDRYWCEQCERDFCDECISSCASCSTSLCYSCLGKCEFCDEPVCDDCLTKCTECGDSCCSSCLDEGLCPACQQQLEVPNDNTNENQPLEATTGERSPERREVHAA